MRVVYPNRSGNVVDMETEGGVATMHTGNGLLVTVREMGEYVSVEVDLKFPEGERRLVIPALTHGSMQLHVKATTTLTDL